MSESGVVLVITGEMPTQNDVLNLTKGGNAQWGRYRYTQIKREWEERIWGDIVEQGIDPLDNSGRYRFSFHWVCTSRRHDPDNVAWACKIVLDALVRGGIMSNDGWRTVGALTHRFSVDRNNPRVVVEITPIDPQ